MAGSVLTEQYVDIVARNLRETMDALRAIQRQADATGEAFKRMRSQASGPVMPAAQQAAQPVRLPDVAGPMRRPAGGAAGLGGEVNALRQMQQLAGMLPGALGAVATAAGPVGIALAAVGAALSVVGAGLALVSQGFQGTAEMDQFGQAVQMIARELAAFFAPAVQLAADLLKQMVGIFQSTGAAGQQLISMLAFGPVFEVLTNGRVQAAFKGLMAAVGQLVQVMQPLLNLLANIGTKLIEAIVVEPLVLFTKGLTVAVLLMKELAERTFALARAFGLLRNPLFNAPDQQRRQVTLQQTGTEDATSTFQRIQQAVLRAGGPKEVPEQQLTELQEIRKQVDTIVAKFDAVVGLVQTLSGGVTQAVTNPTASAQGTIANAVPGLATGLVSLFGAR